MDARCPDGAALGGATGGTALGGATGGTALGGATGGTALGGATGGTALGGATGGTALGGATGGTALGGATWRGGRWSGQPNRWYRLGVDGPAAKWGLGERKCSVHGVKVALTYALLSSQP